jgi:hypothetical protein
LHEEGACVLRAMDVVGVEPNAERLVAAPQRAV